MGSRLRLHELLVGVLGNDHVYFQPPESMKLVYPCIVYSLGDIKVRYADNKAYTTMNAYDVTFISRDPDNTYAVDMLNTFELCRFDRRFTNDNLYHDVFTLHFKEETQ